MRPSSIQALTNSGISASVSGFKTTKGYSTRQSVASVTCATREMPSKAILSEAVYRFKVFLAFFRNDSTTVNSASNRSTAPRAAFNNTLTCSAESAVMRFSTSPKRCHKASTNICRRLLLSNKSSCKNGLRWTTQMSPKTSNNMRAERPVRRLARNAVNACQASSPNKRITTSRSEKEV